MNTLYRLRASYRLIQATTPASLGFLLRSGYSTKSKKQESQQDKTTSTVRRLGTFAIDKTFEDWPHTIRMEKHLNLMDWKYRRSTTSSPTTRPSILNNQSHCGHNTGGSGRVWAFKRRNPRSPTITKMSKKMRRRNSEGRNLRTRSRLRWRWSSMIYTGPTRTISLVGGLCAMPWTLDLLQIHWMNAQR